MAMLCSSASDSWAQSTVGRENVPVMESQPAMKYARIERERAWTVAMPGFAGKITCDAGHVGV
jgi:hypothetical protein